MGIPPTSSSGKKSESAAVTAISDDSLRSLKRTLAAEKISEEMISINSGHDDCYHDSSSRGLHEEEDEKSDSDGDDDDDENNEYNSAEADYGDETHFKEQENRTHSNEGSIQSHRECYDDVIPRHSVYLNSDCNPIQACGVKPKSGELGRSFNSTDRSSDTATAFGSL